MWVKKILAFHGPYFERKFVNDYGIYVFVAVNM